MPARRICFSETTNPQGPMRSTLRPRHAAVRITAPVLPGILAAGCADPQDTSGRPPVVAEARSEAVSLLGEELFAPALPEDVRVDREAKLAQARAAAEASPDDPEATIWGAVRSS